ncbi:MAG: galactokinase [Planctomycetaceae bacterium]
MRDHHHAPRPFVVTAPGRVNLIGEHTDYNDGFVLPMAIERGVRIVVTPRADRYAVLRSTREPDPVEIDLARPLVPGRRDWARYPLGVIAGYADRGFTVPGFTAEISADLPAGGGLSSSAALEVATATVIETLCGRALPAHDKALLCQRAEHEFAGVPCGIMDQFAVTCGRVGHALLLDCRSREIRHVPCGDVAVLVADSGVKHALADGEYARRRAECEAASRALGVASLRDVSAELWHDRGCDLPDPLRRRAAHVVSENARVHRFTAALEARDWPTAGRIMGESHESLHRDYEVSCPELDLLVESAAGVAGLFGCRMTGGGFGGCVVALAEPARAAAALATLLDRYRAASGIETTGFLTRAAGGPVVHA